jgi:competence protein ComFC
MFLTQKSEFLKIKNYKIKNCLLDVLFPKYCLGCGKEGLYICKKCEIYMMDVPQPIGGISFWEYNGIIKEAIHRIKFNGEYNIIKELIAKKDFELQDGAIITFVPMHIKKKKKRGFNQAEIIAREIGRKTGRPVVKLLEKVKETKDQASLGKEARLDNVKGSFREAPACRQAGVHSILLVDDVYTSGATMQECSRVLRKAGFENISYFTLARTV